MVVTVATGNRTALVVNPRRCKETPIDEGKLKKKVETLVENLDLNPASESGKNRCQIQHR